MKVHHFGPGDRPLLGTLHSPPRLRGRSAAVLLCNPFGEEAARAHRIYRVMATRLERSGFTVLRFDYGGTGDSLGASEDVSLAGWIDDIRTAADWLLAASGAKKLVVLGLRLGATLAALATTRGPLQVHHLLLWEPVLDGAAHLRELAELHRSYMRAEMGGTWRDPRPANGDGLPSESLGTPISAHLAEAIGRIDLRNDEPRADHITLIVRDGDEPELEPLRRTPVHAIRLPAAAETWNSDAALNAAVVPMDAVQAIVERISAVSP